MADYRVKDFTGGITDFPIGSNSTVYEKAENFIINEYGDLETRPGTRLDFTTDGQRARVGNEVRVSLMAEQSVTTAESFTILKVAGSKIYYDDTTDMVELQGPASAEAFPSLTVNESSSFAEWNKHTILSHEGYGSAASQWQQPIKVYRDDSGNLQLRTAGLPRGDFSGTTATGGTGANYIYAFVYKYSYNVGDTEYIDRSRPYLKEYTNIGTTTSSSAPAIGIASMDTLANGTGEHHDTTNVKIEIYRTINNGSVLYYVDEVTNGTTTYTDNDSDDTLLAEGVTLYTTGGVLANDRPPKCKYVHGTTDFVYYGNGFEVAVDASDNEIIPNRVWQSKRGDPDSVPASFFVDIEEEITGISSIKSVPIVFGKNSVYRLDGRFDDLGRGGIFPRKISDGIGCVGHLSIVQTMDGLYFAANDGLYYTNGAKVVGLTEQQFKTSYSEIIDTASKRKRIYGVFDSDNNRILWAASDDDRGSVGENNEIFCMYIPTKTFTRWASGSNNVGPYLEETANINGTTLTLGNTDSITAGDPIRVADDNTVYVLSVDSDTTCTLSASFSNASYDVKLFANDANSIEYYENFQPSSLLFANNTLWQGDGRGFCLDYSDSYTNDTWIDATIDGAAGATAISESLLGILHNYAGPILDLGTTSYRKWVNGVVMKMRPKTDIAVITAAQLYGENDDNDNRQEMQEIFAAAFYPWGTPLLSYGDPRLWRRVQKMVDVKRRFPANTLRCDYKQIHLESAYVALYNSDVYGTATVATVSGIKKTATLSGSSSWPDNMFNHWVSFQVDGSTDGYTLNLKVVSRDSGTQVTFLDPTGAVSDGASQKWVVRVFPPNNFINLIEYSYLYQMLGPSQDPYTGDTGSNA